MSDRRYQHYKDSMVDWLGEVPRHWTTCALNYRYEVALGKMLDEKKITGRSLASYLRNVDVQWGSINVVDLPQMDFGDVDEERYGLLPGDLLTCEGGEVGRSAIWTGNLQPCFYQKALHRIRARTIEDTTRFLFYVFRAAADQRVFTASEGRSTIAHLTAEALRRYVLPFPPVSEQEAISDFLDRETAKIDALVAEQEKLIELLKEKRQAVISHAVTKGLDLTAPMKNSGVEWLGEVPAHWNLVQLKRMILFQRGHDLPQELRTDGKFPVVSSGGVIGFHEQSQAKGPGIVTGRYGTIGNFKLIEEDYWPLNTALYSIQIAGSPKFLWYMLQNLSEHFIMNSMKSAVPGVDRNDIHGVLTAQPTTEEQELISSYLDQATKKIDDLVMAAEGAVSLLKERRSALISAAVMGRMDVRGLVDADALEPA
jgi:type I restriction enzyme, S subunit